MLVVSLRIMSPNRMSLKQKPRCSIDGCAQASQTCDAMLENVARPLETREHTSWWLHKGCHVITRRGKVNGGLCWLAAVWWWNDTPPRLNNHFLVRQQKVSNCECDWDPNGPPPFLFVRTCSAHFTVFDEMVNYTTRLPTYKRYYHVSLATWWSPITICLQTFAVVRKVVLHYGVSNYYLNVERNFTSERRAFGFECRAGEVTSITLFQFFLVNNAICQYNSDCTVNFY